ncbi:MAG: polysaccharide biosynthesis C-terminal domain-containing protein [Planctomycetes bacterium]|nr:polysaccharide biosynthesis C-terminal domain-containing protein [Planctomycetota bacterium]
MVARQFGRSDDLDAFLIALVVPMTLVGVIAGAFQAAFAPAYARVRERVGDRAGQALVANALGLSLALLLAMALALGLAEFWLIGPLTTGFSPAKRELALSLSWRLVPWVPLAGASLVVSGILNASHRFAVGALAPALTPAVVAVAILCATNADACVLADATVAGAAGELVVVWITLRRTGLGVIPQLRVDEGSREFLRMVVPALAAGVIMRGTTLVNQVMAASFDSGSVAALSYAARIVAFPTSIAVLALSTALLPNLSELAAAGRFAELHEVTRRVLVRSLALTVPIALGLALFARPVVAAFFEHGRFTANDTEVVTLMLRCFAAQVPFYVADILAMRALSALGRNRLLPIVAVVDLAVNVMGNLIFGRLFGPCGIALATSLVYAVSSCVMWLLFRRALCSSRSAILPKS